jgi:hypothetical protein
MAANKDDNLKIPITTLPINITNPTEIPQQPSAIIPTRLSMAPKKINSFIGDVAPLSL